LGGIEVKAFLGATVSGVVIAEGGDPTIKDKMQQVRIRPEVAANPASDDGAAEKFTAARFIMPAKVNADGSFAVKGLPAGRVSFQLIGLWPNPPRIKRIERDGVEINDAIDVRQGETITGVRIVIVQGTGRIRGQVQVVGGKLPTEWGLKVSASKPKNLNEVNTGDGSRAPAFNNTSKFADVDEKGRFMIEGLPAGDFELSVFPISRTEQGGWASVDSPRASQRVTVRENDEISITVTLDLAHK
jgi:hypothetical protein